MQGYRVYRLREIASEILIGQIMKRVSYKEGEKATGYEKEGIVLLPSAISGGIIHRENLGKVRLKKDPDPDRFLTQKNDIIIKLSSPYNCALVTEENVGLIVPSFCAIIRGIDAEKMDVRYLTGFLNSAYARTNLTAGMDISGMAMLRKKSLEDLIIDGPRMHVQRVAGRAYWDSCRKKYILQRMADRQQVSSDSVIIETVKKEMAFNDELLSLDPEKIEKLYPELSLQASGPMDDYFEAWESLFYGSLVNFNESMLNHSEEYPAGSRINRIILAAFVVMMKCLDDNCTEFKLNIPNMLRFPMFAFTVEKMSSEMIPYDELKTYLRELQSALDSNADLEPDFLYDELERCGLRTDMDYLRALFREVEDWEFKDESGIISAIMVIYSFMSRSEPIICDGMRVIPEYTLQFLKEILPAESGMNCYGIMDGNSFLLPLLLTENAAAVTVNTVKDNTDNRVLSMIFLLLGSHLHREKIRNFSDPWIPVGEESQMGTYDMALVVPPFSGPTNVQDTAYKYGSQEADSLIEWFPEKMNCGDWIYARHMIKALGPGGIGYIILPLGMLSRMGTYMEVRRLFLDSDVLDCVIEFSPGDLGETSTALLIIKKKRNCDTVQMVNLSGEYGRNLLIEPNGDIEKEVPRSGLSKAAPVILERRTARFVSRDVTKEEIADNGYCFSPSAYIMVPPNLDDMEEELKMSMKDSEDLEKEYVETCNDYETALRDFKEELEKSSLE